MRSSIPFRSLVSIILINEPKGNYLNQTIESIKNQTYENWELIIIENMSKNENASRIKETMMEDSRIKLVTVPESTNLADAYNIGIGMAKGHYLAFIHTDDIWSNHKLEKQLEYMEAHNIAFSCANYQVINENTNTAEPTVVVMPERTTYASFLHNVNLIAGSTVMIDRYIIGKIQLASEENIHTESAIWLSILKRGFKVYGIKEVLLFKRKPNKRAYKNVAMAWALYRHVEKMNIFESAYCFVNNVKSEVKYRNLNS
ncbi:glycosyltransferase family 2 protein [Pradoshia sp.]